MADEARDVEAPSIGTVHFRLRVPHANLADYRRLQRFLIRPFVRRQAWRNAAIGLPIGALIAIPLVAGAIHWDFSADLILEFELRGFDRAVVLDGATTWFAVFAMFFAGIVAARIDGVVLYRAILRGMYSNSLRKPSDWTMLVGE